MKCCLSLCGGWWWWCKVIFRSNPTFELSCGWVGVVTIKNVQRRPQNRNQIFFLKFLFEKMPMPTIKSNSIFCDLVFFAIIFIFIVLTASKMKILGKRIKCRVTLENLRFLRSLTEGPRKISKFVMVLDAEICVQIGLPP